MSNIECADLYERIINEVIQESRQDFEDSGIDEQTLIDLRDIWRSKLSSTNVAKFSFTNDDDDEDNSNNNNININNNKDEDSKPLTDLIKTGLPTASTSANDLGLHLPKSENSNDIILPGALNNNRIDQTDGSISFEISLDNLKNLRKNKKKNKSKTHRKRLQQADGGFDDSIDDDDLNLNRGGNNDDDSDLGSDLGVDSDEINSDLDDPEDEDNNSEEDNDDPETNIMLCLYDRVQRVRNRWKCNLKDGLANIDGKDYSFQKATGDSEW